MLVECWFTVCDAETTFNQQWVDVLCLLGKFDGQSCQDRCIDLICQCYVLSLNSSRFYKYVHDKIQIIHRKSHLNYGRQFIASTR